MLTRWQSTIVDAQGNIQPFAILTILNEETQAPAQIYASESESQPLPAGTVVANESGYAYFYARGGRYRIQSNDLSIDWRHVPLGDLQGMDESDLGAAATLDVATTEQAENLIDDDVLITPKKLGDSMNAHVLGMGQSWQDVTNSRNWGTTYTNTTGKPIMVSVVVQESGGGDMNFELLIGGLAVSAFVNVDATTATATAVVPNGSSYSVSRFSNNNTIIVWAELR